MATRTEDSWLGRVVAELERSTGGELAMTREDVDELLRLASFAAHSSGAKLNAPLLCYVVGRAAEATGRPVAEIASIARGAQTVAT